MTNATHNRLRRFFPLVTFVGMAFTASAVSAGVNTWMTHGPDGGDIRALAVDIGPPWDYGYAQPGLYAGTWGGGVFRSTDGGSSWNAVNTGLTDPGVVALAIDRNVPATLYAVGTRGGVFRTTSTGGSWSAVNSGLTGALVSAVAIDPVSGSTIYVGTDRGVFKSTNSAESWTPMNAGLDSLTQVLSLAVAPSVSAILYASTNRGVFKSDNGGESWSAINAPPTIGTVNALAIDPLTPDTLYAGAVSDDDLIRGGLFRSTDGGASWSHSLVDRDVFALSIDPSVHASLLAGTGGGVLKSSNGGTSWTESLSGNRPVYALTVEPSVPTAFYAGTFSGVFRSSDGGGSWTAVNDGLVASSVNALAIDPSSPATLYAGTSDGGVFRSSNSGGSWRPINAGLTIKYVSALAIDPLAPATLYAGTQPGGVFKSINGGESWTPTSIGQATYVTALAIDPSPPGTLYAGAGGVGVFKSIDGGGSWTAVNSGLTNYSFRGLAIDPLAPGTLYAATDDGVFKSTNSGSNWTLSLAGQAVYTLAIDPSAPPTIYAGTYGSVFKSGDGGESWTAVSTGLTHLTVNALVVDASAPETLYAGTIERGVFKSTNAGSTWTAINAGLRNPWVNALAIDPFMRSRVYAGTRGGGVFDYLDSSCSPGPTTLCLSGGRFKVTTQWTTAAGQSGSGHAITLAGGDTGYFTFFDTGNVEVAVKVLNGCDSSGSFWIFAGGLTNVGVVMTVTDSLTGTVKSYSNPPGTPFRPIEDVTTFATCAAGSTGGVRPYDRSAAGSLLPPSFSESGDARATQPCVADRWTLCLSNSRYKVRAEGGFTDPDFGFTGLGLAEVINLTGDTGAFWFFSPSNVEVVVKVLDGCGLNSRYWTFAGGLTNVNVILTVTDTQTGSVKTYINPEGVPFEPIQDTNAFATCP